ncbi:hypothetical protein FSP39_023544 [Pinctada imbricata]|uniref:Uncharacterized protein n=1 Tax=Pinctada imbricata TaxID=66713 RepID=A0AA89BTJ4_PINIB|nr:hypothetical protein FSP39_023544 [Pinctada imbricata]
MEIVLKSLVVIAYFQLISANLEKDLRVLSRILPGIYTNRNQFLRDAKLPSDKRHKSMQAIFRPAEIPFLEDSYNLYVEKYSNYNKQPFRQWIYSFETNHTQKAIILKIYDIKNAAMRRNLARNVNSIKRLNHHDLSTRTECNLLWRRTVGKNFHGTTGPDCVANTNGEKVQVEISASLTATDLLWQEGWYKLSNGKVVFPNNGPTVFNKVKKIKGPRYLPRLSKQIKTFERQYQLKANKRLVKRRKGRRHIFQERKISKQRKDILSDSHVTHKLTRTRFISTFHDIKDALLSGAVVSYFANMSSCLMSGEMPDSVRTFGGPVDVFDIYVVNGDTREVVRFSTSSRRNVEFGVVITILREIKIFQDGTTVVDTYHLHSGDGHVIKQAMAVCKLFNQRSRTGSIKFTTATDIPTKDVTSYDELRIILGKGRTVRMVADLSLCAHYLSNLRYIAGQITGSEILVSNGSAILRVDIRTKTKSVVIFKPFARIIGVAADLEDDWLFWSDVGTDYRGLYKSRINGSEQQILVKDVYEVNGLTVDWVSDHVYWSDAQQSTINVINYDGRGRHVLLSLGAAHEPRGIIADPVVGSPTGIAHFYSIVGAFTLLLRDYVDVTSHKAVVLT